MTKRDEGGAPSVQELAQGPQSSAISRRKAIKLGGSALVASALAGLFPSRAEAQPKRPFKALTLYWSPDRQDNFTTGTKQGRNDAIAAGYQYIRNEGYCVRTSRRWAQWQEGTKALKLYWSEARGTTSPLPPSREKPCNGGWLSIHPHRGVCLQKAAKRHGAAEALLEPK